MLSTKKQIEQFIRTNNLTIVLPKTYKSHLEEAGFKYLKDNTADLVLKYMAEMSAKGEGRIVNTDNVRDLFNVAGYNKYNANDFHEPASCLTKIIYEIYLTKFGNKDLSKILFLIGSPGSGKTSSVKNLLKEEIKNYDVIFDGVLSGFDSLQRKLIQSKNKFYIPVVIYIYAPPKNAYKNSLDRMQREKRQVPLDMFIKTYSDFKQTLNRLSEIFDGNLDFTILNNSFGQGQAKKISVEETKTLDYEPKKDDLIKIIIQYYENGKINEEQLIGIFQGNEVEIRNVKNKKK